MPLPANLQPPTVGPDFVRTKCDYFTDVQLWPISSHLNVQGWLGNFSPDEMNHAVHLLNGFNYYSSSLVGEMFAAAFHSLCQIVLSPQQPLASAEADWQRFRNDVLVTYVTGETPNPTDSGFAFARRARQDLGLDERQIIHPNEALSRVSSGTASWLLFVDDFVGSGDQFISTWQREYDDAPLGAQSFRAIASSGTSARFIYCPVICTQIGYDAIKLTCPQVLVRPCHVLGAEYRVVGKDSMFWPPKLLDSAWQFVLTASKRAGISEHDALGHNALGMAIAFEHSVPDATIPIIYHKTDTWCPLLRRK
jgi:hypothetical protein